MSVMLSLPFSGGIIPSYSTMTERDRPEAFEEFVNSLDFSELEINSEKTSLLRMSPVERAGYLEPEERDEFIKGYDVRFSVLAAVKCNMFNTDSRSNRSLGILSVASEQDKALTVSTKLLGFLNNEENIRSFFDEHNINKSNLNLKIINTNSGFHEHPDLFGLKLIIEKLNDSSVAEMDNRLQTPYNEDHVMHSIHLRYKDETGGDLTGIYHTSLFMYDLKKLYLDSLAYGSFPEQDILSAPDSFRYRAGMSYESALLTLKLYEMGMEMYDKLED